MTSVTDPGLEAALKNSRYMKNYDLIISSNDDLVKFTVIDRSSLVKFRMPVLFGALAYLINCGVRLYQQFEISVLDACVVFGTLLIAVVTFLYQERQDELLVMKNIGIQLNSKTNWKFFTKADKNMFIPHSNIIDLVIHEGFYGYGQVIFYMCILTKNGSNNGTFTQNKTEEMIKVVFSELLPRKEILLTVWKQSREMLFGTNKRYFRRVPGQGLKLVE